jgi:hypothetical protein
MGADDDRPIADITLERYRLRELPADVTARLDERLRADDELRRRLDALQLSDDQIHASNQLDLIASGIGHRLAARQRTNAGAPPSRLIRRWAMPVLVATGILLAIVLPRLTSVSVEDEDRIKGLRTSLALFRRVGAGSETLADGAVAHQGDLIRVGYHAAGRGYGMILSVDGRGHVTVHLPDRGERAVPLRHEPTVLLDQAYELDDAPKWERFYFVTADEPFMIAPVIASAQRAVTSARGGPPASLELSAGLEQSVFSLQKESKP